MTGVVVPKPNLWSPCGRRGQRLALHHRRARRAGAAWPWRDGPMAGPQGGRGDRWSRPGGRGRVRAGEEAALPAGARGREVTGCRGAPVPRPAARSSVSCCCVASVAPEGLVTKAPHAWPRPRGDGAVNPRPGLRPPAAHLQPTCSPSARGAGSLAGGAGAVPRSPQRLLPGDGRDLRFEVLALGEARC